MLALLVHTTNLLVQLGLVALGIHVVVEPNALAGLALWVGVASVYVVVVGVMITTISKRPRTTEVRQAPRMYISWVGRFITTVSTLGASLVGIAGAILVRARYGEDGNQLLPTVLGTMAMLLSWGLLHWGYAQLYYRRHCRSDRPVVEFPETEHPHLSDFVYFAFTIGTAFATSDAKVLSPRLRWTVTKHSILSFFYNGAIIVLALNTLTASA